MTVLRAKDRDTNEPGDVQLVANVLLDAARDDRHSAKDWRKMRGWEATFRNRLVREAGCGYSTALDLITNLRRDMHAPRTGA